MKDTPRVKILILGESSVGKSSLLTQFVEQKFTGSHMPTIGVEYKQKIIEIDDNSLIKVQIWDTAGTERFRTITPVYYRNVDGVLLVFDITDKESFETINYWVEELNSNADIASIELMLVGNKNDLEDNRTVNRSEAEEVSSKIGIPYCETSAKNYESTQEAFNKLINSILKRKKKQVPNGGGGGTNTGGAIVLTQSSGNKKDKKKN